MWKTITNLERRAGNELVSEFDADVVISGFSRHVLDGARSIAVIAASHLGLGRAFDGQTQSSGSSTFRLDGEDVGLVDNSAFQSRTESFHFTGIASATASDRERRSGHRDTVVQHVDFVWP